ncbi:pyrimidine 5'-nucleotidase [Limibacillus sp. MBR-115]|uniref:pyrimidine 5'-nucleotidase n=1 Tax=Limibacillus sp. MBR-115 TaxID=3156465 RepID=UPI003396C263
MGSTQVDLEHKPFTRDDAEVWVFDLDNTLYPATSDLFPQVSDRIRSYVQSLLGLDAEAAHALQKDYYRRYGTTMNGLMQVRGIDPKAYLDFVHDIDLSPIVPDPRVIAAIERLPGRKLIYTNGSTPHAERILDRLGLSAHFEGIFDIVAADYRPKPGAAAFDSFLERHAVDPRQAVFVEDTARNLVPAHMSGMVTVWLDHGHPDTLVGLDRNCIHFRITDLPLWLESL